MTVIAKTSGEHKLESVTSIEETLPNRTRAWYTYDKLIACLSEYQHEYNGDFYFLSLMRDNPFHNELAEFCHNKGINYKYVDNIMIPEHLINGGGHLNKQGNAALGEALYTMLKQTGWVR